MHNSYTTSPNDFSCGYPKVKFTKEQKYVYQVWIIYNIMPALSYGKFDNLLQFLNEHDHN